MATKNDGKTIFVKKLPDDSADTIGVKNFAEIAPSHTFSVINALLYFRQKFKMAAKNDCKSFLGKIH